MNTNTNNTISTVEVWNTIQHRITEVTTTNTATGEKKSTVKAVNLKAANFGNDKDVWKMYREGVLASMPYILKAAKALDGDKDAFPEARKALIPYIQNVANILSKYSNKAPVTVTKKDAAYICRLSTIRKVDKDAKRLIVNLKSPATIQGLIEDTIYCHINNIPLPTVSLTDKTAEALLKLKEAEKGKDAEKKTTGTTKPTGKKPTTKKPTAKPEAKKPEAEAPTTENKAA